MASFSESVLPKLIKGDEVLAKSAAKNIQIVASLSFVIVVLSLEENTDPSMSILLQREKPTIQTALFYLHQTLVTVCVP